MTSQSNEISDHIPFGSERGRNDFSPLSNGQINSAELLGSGNQLIIQHLGEHYYLRQTRAGKLILTK